MGISLDITNLIHYAENIDRYFGETVRAKKLLLSGKGRGADSLGWLSPEIMCPDPEYRRIKVLADRIRNDSEVLLVIGIGGSYLGAKAALDFILSPNYNNLNKETPDILFTGNTLSPESIRETVQLIEDRDFSINIISKSGGTTEPMTAFRYFRDILEKRYGKDKAGERITVTTGRTGILRSLAMEQGYGILDIPENVGGRYSVLSACGLLPLEVAGIDTRELTNGAETVFSQSRELPEDSCPSIIYAAARNALYRGGKKIEILATNDPAMRFMGEWWKQLFAESEGKGGRGIFPTCVNNTADLHSMGQYIQQGERSIFETFLQAENYDRCVKVPDIPDNDGLGYLAGREFGWMNAQVAKAVALAHFEGGVPNMTVTVEERSGKCFGELAAFFELACALSGYTLGVDPFDQPGVENYKSNMQALLGDPRYEKKRLPDIAKA